MQTTASIVCMFVMLDITSLLPAGATAAAGTLLCVYRTGAMHTGVHY